MGDERRIVKCGLCGHEMAIPPGYENVKAFCRVCGAEVQTGAAPSQKAPQGEKAPSVPPPVVASAGQERFEDLRGSILKGVAAGFIGMLIGGGIVATHNLAVFGRGGQTLLSFIVLSADLGAQIGFVLLCTWTIVKGLKVGPLGGMVVGVCTSFPVGVATYFLEWAAIAQPDDPFWQMALVAVFGGWTVGLIMGYVASTSSD